MALALAGAEGVAGEYVSPGLCVVGAALVVGAGGKGVLSAAASPPGSAGGWLAGGAGAAASTVGRSTEGSREAVCFFSAGVDVSLAGRLTTWARYADLCRLLPPAPAGLPPMPCCIPQGICVRGREQADELPGRREGRL